MKTIMIAVRMFLIMTVITGILYPLLITGVVQLTFPEKANGSLVIVNNKTVGSRLIGQSFDTAIYFSSRPSAVSYNPLPSGGSNYGLTNVTLKKLVEERKQKFLTFNQIASKTVIPSEMLFASASGLDPHISPEAAFLQVDRVAKSRHFSFNQKQKLRQLIVKLSESPQYLCLGEERVNVLLLNLETDTIK